ncbi:hypothetical protein V6615_02095 [Oscillospiraceae bacterium PP1C4]
MKLYRYVWTPFAVAVAVGLLWKTQEVTAGVRAGLLICASVIIPSLFPFMILAGLIASTQVGAVLSRLVSVFTRRTIGLPENLGAVLLMSFVGGFPVGARMLSSMLERHEIDRETANRALCFCVNAGPSFLISALGASMLGSKTAGLLVLAAQILSSLMIGAFLFYGKPLQTSAAQTVPQPRDTFVGAVQSASAGILSICAFVVAFSAITALLNALGILSSLAYLLSRLFPFLGEPFFLAALTGLLEVTRGCIAASALHTRAGFILCAFLVSFSSMSIIFQVKSCFSADSGVNFGMFYNSRLAHGTLTALFAALAYRLIPPAELAVTAVLSTPIPKATPNMLVTCACLICMCSMLLLPAPRRKC